MPEFELEDNPHAYFPFGFQLSRQAWESYAVASLVGKPGAEQTESLPGRVRVLAWRINEKRLHSTRLPEPVHAGQLLSVGLINEILRFLVAYYTQDERPGTLSQAQEWTGRRFGPQLIDHPPPAFVRLFPPQAVAGERSTPDEYLRGASPTLAEKEAANREIVLGEMILLWLAGENPAFRPYRDLFDDADLRRQTPYEPLIAALDRYFAAQPPVTDLGMTLFEALRAPMKNSPHSLEGQLLYLREHWAKILPARLLARIARTTDILREEETMRGLGPGPAQVLRFAADATEYGLSVAESEAFSRDADWMSNVVLIAKSVYVWLDQLGKKYRRAVRTLAEIPDEELDRLARWGFTGLWLIGLWRRSPASRQIKRIMGNPEAVSSAYSLYDYVIADDLGGEEAYRNLRERAGQRGIRLASDMVPNHTGLYSKWVIEHPDWFVQVSAPPFPVYRFTGVDLSEDPAVEIRLEDGYWDRRDAAVVFRRMDRRTGETRYIYHGNDGTTMPWNDTAQLNFLLPAVREAVIQTILHVARKFPIIRFDAAMTLAKRHYQRLWFPLPGEGGAIPSRAEHGLTKEAFDAAFPAEFWREVVDRVAAEAPDTLLLAEAFWLMEGYFVRTLGMHRVYNSAFMNMLKMEENAKYRATVKNVLEFTPEVLKRFVNFMNNPDEDTAVAQFGRDDKYIGVALLMVTMPGLPMFGHGQVEGLTEKYGMEYCRAYWDEKPDEHLIRRHEMEIFPLMRRRLLFSGSENFAFFDFYTPDGRVDENVFAYANRAGEQRAVILYNNAYTDTRGRIRQSTPINLGVGDHKNLVRRSLAEALSLRADEHVFLMYRDHKSGLEYLRAGRKFAHEGLAVELRAYQYFAFLDFHEIVDADGSWAALETRLDGRGVPDMAAARRELQLEPLLNSFRALLAPATLAVWRDDDPAGRERGKAQVASFLTAVGEPAETADKLLADLEELFAPALVPATEPAVEHILAAWLVVRRLGSGNAVNPPANREESVARYGDLLLQKTAAEAFRAFVPDDETATLDALLVRLLLRFGGEATDVAALFADQTARQCLLVNTYREVAYFNKEQLAKTLAALLGALKLSAAGADIIAAEQARFDCLRDAAEQCGYRLCDMPVTGEAKQS